ncbi:polysaccharide deacetylase [Fadolivirus algeromassiliense]|jgi:peptidoglycan/xylan/chitin deacetylase (PgdA/CDA1 family)|uniref:Polysaccharide deacetylase n=1 Tax=Fadolivirus FV1/VV64 TaxID=3070911 RepID=A0A7D3UQ65_9VIRU|nr:polysaccharide deacetylase [Fadolivirus algeromassiliense]QKF93513.1 polysaccharide deacetylase [Fadolivirus FV1/VV64]
MIGEIILFSPLLIFWYFNIIGWKIFLLCFSIYYWLPKWLFLKLFVEKYYPQIITRDPTAVKKVVLTFDDIPYGSHKGIIDLLDRYNMKGVFFVISDYVDNLSKKILINAVLNGHQLGNHGKTNSIHALKSKLSLETEINSCDKLIKDIYDEAGVRLPSLMVYRPGCGLFNNRILKLMNDKGYTLALGSVYPNDPLFRWSLLNYYYIINHIENGDVIILHDREWTISLLEKLLPWLKENGYNTITFND